MTARRSLSLATFDHAVLCRAQAQAQNASIYSSPPSKPRNFKYRSKFPRSKVFAVPFHISVESSPIVFLFVTNAGDSVLLWFDIDIAIVKCSNEQRRLTVNGYGFFVFL